MQDFGTKADNSPPPGGQLSAAEFNNLATENENAVLHSGQTLSGGSATQLATSLFLHGTKAQTFQDNGAANVYVATPVSGASGVLLPTDYAAMDGAIIVLKASAANTAASTLNIGQTTGALLGTKAIVDQAGTALVSGAISASTYIQLRYDSSIGAGSWVLLPWSVLATGISRFTAGGTFVVPAAVTTVYVTAVGGGGGGGGSGDNNLGNGPTGSCGGGGGAGQSVFRTPITVTPGASLAVVIGGAGGGGTGSTQGSNNATGGGSGGTTSLGGSLVALNGGTGGSSGQSANASGRNGPLGGVGYPDGGPGSDGAASGSGNGWVGAGGAGGSSPFGGGGPGGKSGFTTENSTNGFAGFGFGSGGGGGGVVYSVGGNGRNGGAGTPGLMIIEW